MTKPSTIPHSPSSELLPPVGKEDALLASQLTAQYVKAVGGVREIVIFGAMMIMLREKLVSTRGHGNTNDLRTKEGGGVEGWLETHCPEISRPTAYRFMSIAEGLKDEFKLGPRTDLHKLLTAPEAELDEKSAKRRVLIWEFVNGKSQRQLLLGFMIGKPQPKLPGGDTSAFPRNPDNPRIEAEEFWRSVMSDIELNGLKKKTWAHMYKQDIELVHGLLFDLATLMGQALKKK